MLLALVYMTAFVCDYVDSLKMWVGHDFIQCDGQDSLAILNPASDLILMSSFRGVNDVLQTADRTNSVGR